MKTKILITIMFLISLLSINFVDANTCSFLDSNGDCLTTAQDFNDVKSLASLKSINCAWSNCQSTLDVNGDGLITSADVILIKSIVQLEPLTIDGAPSNINLEFINNNTQLKIIVTDSDGTPRSDIGVNFTVLEYPSTYNGLIYTHANGEVMLNIPAGLLMQSWTGKVWFNAEDSKQIPYTEKTIVHNPSIIVNPAPIYCIEECSDGIDNDGDGLIDLDDFGCTDSTDKNEVNNGVAQCSNGIDNDGDGLIDQNDPGCLNYFDNNEDTIVTLQCSDSIDNDGDGSIDYNDLNCYANGLYNPNDNNETYETNTVAFYNFNELSGNVVNDVSGNNLNGIATGTLIVNGLEGKARLFDGNYDWIEIPFNSLMNVPIITVEANIKLNTFSGYQRIVDRFYYPGSRAWSFYIVGDKLGLSISADCNNAPFEVSTSTPLTTGEWHHVAFTYDGSVVKMYQDGNIIFSQAYIGGICTAGTSNMLIGTYTTKSESFFNGIIDEVRISNFARY